MDITNTQDWVQGTEALKNGFGLMSDVIGFLKRIAGKGSPDEQKAIEKALFEAEEATKIAKIQIAKALGYELCKCHFPPAIMLTVGYRSRGPNAGETVHECPKCNRNTAAPHTFERIADKSTIDA